MYGTCMVIHLNFTIVLKRNMHDKCLYTFPACFKLILIFSLALQPTIILSITTCHKKTVMSVKNVEDLRKDSFPDKCVEKC